MKIYDFEIIFKNGDSDIYASDGENEFEAIRNFLNSTKGAINYEIQSINML
jgi:hypothetical protein